ncbi:hypothetical protein [Runella limosa]|uniref:hypothetical protein n=1 Tax=Runella limosa TaxID=370978 RepID=UPI0012FB0B62|nr:hypothetical protein [Runella limosa]
MKKIFETYTGNSFLDNALYTLEGLGSCNITELNVEKLKKLFQDPYKKGHQSLMQLNKRLKNYTMLFTKNGPLHNDKEFGERIYKTLMESIIDGFEDEGENICELSGMRFHKKFETYYAETLQKIGYPADKIIGKDKTINRCWFPLIGGLGSDAQALPQARRAIQIHPIWVVVMQFLPLSAVIFKGGVLLVDSSNFEFAKLMVAKFVDEIKSRAESVSVSQQIENYKDYAKGNYILQALSILDDKEDYDDEYTDINLWSFSNSGTGASCEIDRVPNRLIRKLLAFKKDGYTSKRLGYILNNPKLTNSFLESLETNNDWWGLYIPIDKDKNLIESKFLEKYYELIGKKINLDYAKYIAFLLNIYVEKEKNFAKLIDSSLDAYKDDNYRVEIYKALIKATQEGKWSLEHHLQIIDNPDSFPIKNTFYSFHKLIHFYYWKKEFRNELPTLIQCQKTQVENACEWLIGLVQIDKNKEKTINWLKNQQYYAQVTFVEILLRQAKTVSMKSVLTYLYDENWNSIRIGLNELLRIFFNQPSQRQITFGDENGIEENPFTDFAEAYKKYYTEKYSNAKFRMLVKSIPNDNRKFKSWLGNTLQEREKYYNEYPQENIAVFELDELMSNPSGERRLNFARFAIKFSLLKLTELNEYQSNEIDEDFEDVLEETELIP